MNIVTGSYSNVRDAEEAFNDLRRARFDHVGFYTRNREKGMSLADDLHLDFKGDQKPRDGVVLSESTVYGQLSETYTDSIRRSNLPADAVNWYRQQLDAGNLLLVVDVGDRMHDAANIVKEHHGMLYGMERSAEWTQEEASAVEEGVVRVPVIDEEIAIEKMRHQVGEVQVQSEVSRRTVDIPTTVTHQEVRVERHKLDRPMRPEEYQGSTTQEGVIRMPIIEEEVHVTKRPIIREEMIVTRVPVEERQTLHEQVQHAEPHIETHGEVDIERKGEEPPRGRKRPAA